MNSVSKLWRNHRLGILVAAALGAMAMAAMPAAAQPAAAADQAPKVTVWSVWVLWAIAPVGACVGLFFAWKFFKEVRAADPGDEKMQAIAAHVTAGAYAYLKRQYKVVAVFFLVAAGLLLVMGWVFHVQHEIAFAAFLTGGIFSGICGFLGMKTATMASNRTTQGAKEGLNRGLTVAFRAGAVMGLVVVGFGLLLISLWFLLLHVLAPLMGVHMGLPEVTVVMLTFGMGASAQALFARVGGGIYTKAADVGADLVGKVEAGIPEDDPRNPATIADNVGDNVGDVAGMGADLYESYCGSILATAGLGVAAAIALGNEALGFNLLALPMVLAGVGILLSILGVYLVRTKEDASMKQLMGALNLGVNGATFLILVVALGACWGLLGGEAASEAGVSWLGLWGSIVTGLVAGVVIGKATEYSTSYDYGPTREVCRSAETGPGTVIISGIAEGMKSTWMSIATIIAAILLAYAFAGGFNHAVLGLYGVGIAAVAMLAPLGIALATDAYGPIADNAGGNAEMTGQPEEVRQRTDALDSLGNTTAAVGKGFAIGSAALTALALIAAYVEQVRTGQNREARQYAQVLKDARIHDNMIQEADKRAKAGVALKDAKFITVAYLGHNKGIVAVAHRERGQVKSALTGGMFLNRLDLDEHPKIWQDNNNKPKEIRMIADGDGVFKSTSIPYTTGEGDKKVNHTVRLRFAPAPIASLRQYMDFYDVTLMSPKVLGGMFAGVLLVFLFSALTMKAVGRAAMAMVVEVRRQFREIPGIMEGTGEPDYARCVDISTAGAQREMILPSLLALLVPIVIGLLLDVPGVLGLLAGGLTCGFAMAVFMANAGGAWDNAKKYVETGEYGGKGSEAHKAAVVGDTVGDPFKDTSGPSLNILIKLMSMVSVVFAGLIVKFAPQIGAWLGM